MEYNPAVRQLKTAMLENGKEWKRIKSVSIPDDFDGFAVDAFSISNYTAKGTESSLLARGQVDNVAIAVGRSQFHILDSHLEGEKWQARVFGIGGLDYVLERSENFQDWIPVINGVRTEGFYLRLTDDSALESGAFYRLIR